MGIHLGEIGLTNLAGPTGPGGSVSGSGAAKDVAFWTNASNISGNANLQWDNVLKTLTVGATGIINAPTINASVLMTTPEIDVGATPFVFKEASAGVLQLGDPSALLNPVGGSGGGSDPLFTFSTGSTGNVLIQGDAYTFGTDLFDPSPPLIVTSAAAVSAVAAFFKNQDTGGNIDFVQLKFSSAESPSIRQYGTFEFQSSGNGDGTSWFGWNFGTSAGNVDSFLLASYGAFLPGADNAQDLGNPTDPFFGGGSRVWRTGFFGTSVVSPLFSVATTAGNTGITTTITTASLVGKTITVKGGIITGFA